MQKKTRSLLEELESIGIDRDISHVIENRANNLIVGAVNLLELLNKHYDPEIVEVLEKKLLSAIKSKDASKFTKPLRKNNTKPS